MRLVDWAKKNGVCYRTAWNWFKNGTLPVPAIQTKTGMILVDAPDATETKSDKVVVYARVSSNDQKKDLDRQVARLVAFATSRGLQVGEVVSEIGSGLNGRRRRLVSLLRNPKAKTLVVEHRDRLARFGADYIEAALAASGRELLIADPGETEDDLVQDVTDVMTSLCARLYGKRSAKNRAKKALEAAASCS